MPKASDFRLVSAQATLFFHDGDSFSQSSFLANMLSKFITRYDGAVQALPLGNTDPQEIPRVFLQSKDGQWRLRASLNRIDSVWVAKDFFQEHSDIAAKIVAKCAEALEHFVEFTPDIQIARLGFVIKRAAQSENPAQELIDRFCNEDSKRAPFNRSESFQIHNHKKYKLSQIGYDINSWVRCRSGLITQPQPSKAILVDQDINIVEDVANIFDSEKVVKFFQESQNEMSAILLLYFPEER